MAGTADKYKDPASGAGSDTPDTRYVGRVVAIVSITLLMVGQIMLKLHNISTIAKLSH